jgi:hypothetical protein
MKEVIKMNKELHETMRLQLESFIEKFGESRDLMILYFLTSNCDVPTPHTNAEVKGEMVEVVREAGIDVDRVLRVLGFKDEEGVSKDC